MSEPITKERREQINQPGYAYPLHKIAELVRDLKGYEAALVALEAERVRSIFWPEDPAHD